MNDQPEVLPGSSKLPTLNLTRLGWNGDREWERRIVCNEEDFFLVSGSCHAGLFLGGFLS